MQFSSSVIAAIDGLMRLHRGELRGAPVQPVWGNFRFPTSLKAGHIERVEVNDPISNESTGLLKLTRQVEFFYRGRRIATVFLDGVELDRDSSNDNDRALWGVRLIGYWPDEDQDGSVIEESVVYVGDDLSHYPR